LQTWQCSFHDHREEAHPAPPMLGLHKATTVIHGQKILLTGYDSCEQVDCNQDFCQVMLTTDFSTQWGLTLKLVGMQSTLQDALLSGKGCAVSNRLYKDETGAAAWIIEGQTLDVCLIGQWHMPGHGDDHSFFQSKLAGIVGILYMLTFWPPKSTKPSLRLACDGLLVITHLTLPHPIDPLEPHFDLLAVAHNLLQMSAFLVQLVFV